MVDARQLINEIKKYPVLYDSNSLGFSDCKAKEKLWEKITAALFPNYNQLSCLTQNTISK